MRSHELEIGNDTVQLCSLLGSDTGVVCVLVPAASSVLKV